MLTERERDLLAPLLARTRSTRAELAAAKQEATATCTRLKESRHGTGWRDRLFGGLFSREPERAGAYRDARRAAVGAAAAVRRREKELARRERRIDTRIKPMMPRLDPGYERFAAAIKQCNRALGECRPMQQRISRAFAARTASANPGGDDKAARTAELAGRQYRQLVARMRNTAPAVGLALDSARRAVHAAGGGADRIRLDTALFDQLSRAAAEPSTRRRPDRAPDPLQRLHRQLDQAIATITRWRADATTAEANAVAKARDRLINESER